MAGSRKDTRSAAESPQSAGAAPETAAEAQPSPTATPVKTHRIRTQSAEDRPRAGGHVLTERGWVPETRQEK